MNLSTEPRIGLDWCPVPGALFTRGSDESPVEQPVAHVRLSGFDITHTPITNAQYDRFVAAGGYDSERFWTEEGWRRRTELGWREPGFRHDPNWSDPDVPVTGVSWWEASAFACWADGSLPTEAQWEHAARGRDGRRYPWGDRPPNADLATFATAGGSMDRRATSVWAHPAGAASSGCLDMAGNLAEWCLDNARPDYRGDETLIDPVHVTSESDPHVVRGGSGMHDASYLRCTSRDFWVPGLRDNWVGFRIVRPSA